jgi:hypothetical protein
MQRPPLNIDYACKNAGKKLQIGYPMQYESNTLALIKAVRDLEGQVPHRSRQRAD